MSGFDTKPSLRPAVTGRCNKTQGLGSVCTFLMDYQSELQLAEMRVD